MYRLTGVRILLSTCALMTWFVTKVDVESAFLEFVTADLDFYVKPPTESKTKSFYWLFLVATYGLGNANAKCQMHFDNILLELGLTKCLYIPQPFYIRRDNLLCLIVVKVVQDLLFGGTVPMRAWIVQVLSKYFT